MPNQKQNLRINNACNNNAQLWYYKKAVIKYNNSTNVREKLYYYSIIQYYLNGNGYAINN
jgi:hypothetical protein